MKKYLIALILFVFTVNYTQAQDTLYVYKGGTMEVKYPLVQIDSLTFNETQDTLNILKNGSTVYKRALVDIDSLSFTQPLPAGTYKDLDGNLYHTVTIGAQTWMLENLKTTKFRNGESIPNVTDGTAWTGLTSAAWCDYNNSPANGTVFGHLYNWYAANDSRNIAPAGWHVPTVDEWATLKNFLIANGYNYDGTTVNNKMAKSLASTTYWYPSANAGAPGNNQMSNNSTGFTALPGGGRYGIATGDFFSLGIGSFWWSSTQFTDIEAWYKALFYGYSFMGDYGDYKKYGYSIRCIKSDLPVITTTAASSITSTSVVSGGNITFDGDDPITSRGICWNTAGNPTIADSKTTDGSGNGIFNSSISGLNPGTTYYVCAYATNSVGTAYGNVITFKTMATTPTLTTVAVTEITANSATSGGNISNDGGSTITVRGVCWSINPNPTTDHFKTTDGAGPGTFSSALTNLIPGTTYYVRAYATNSIGTAYSNEVSFTTLATTPTLTTSAVSAITSTTAVSGGNISADGGASVTARGVCWSTSQNPTITDGKTTDGNDTGEFSSSLTGLLPGTTYYVRAYATNSAGTAYSNEVSFTTLATTPTLTTSAVSAITSTTAVSGGNISADGGASVTARGVCWSTSQNPTITDSKTTEDNGIGEFSSSITGLTPATTYYVRAYATNSIGTAYSNEVSFTTLATTPTLSTNTVSAITSTTAVSGGIISADGGASITEKGVCWNTAGNPTIADSKTTDGNGNGIFNSSISGLNPGTTYYVCAYATNSVGAAYGNVITFKTTATTPTLTTVDVTEITANSATSGGNISNDGGATITVRGLCWSTNPNPTTDHFKTTDGAGPGAFSSALTNLTSGTTYYVRAYATNDMGTSYGNEVSFNTPSVYTSFISDATKSVVSTDTYVHYRTVIPAIGDANDFDLVADNSIVTDLDELVLATANKDGVLEKTFAAYGLGFAGTDYKFEFSLPVYIGLDGVTNHNSFVTLNPTSNVLTVNQDISAIDRTPLVLVKLKSMEENLLAEAYIKFKISN